MRALMLLITLCLAAPAALASNTPTHRAELLAWSTDGLTALVRETTTTPNGGGQRALRLLSRVSPKRVIVSQIDDPSARRPQKVSDSSCAQRLRSLGRVLEKRGFPGVSVAVTCADRARLVTVGPAASARTADTWFGGDGTSLARDGLSLRLRDSVLELSSVGTTIGRWPNTPQPLELQAALSPSYSLVVVFHHWPGGNSGVLKVLASKTGLPDDFKATRP
jgi:hypothetical protein